MYDNILNISKPPRTIARIKLCGGALIVDITDRIQWVPPTPEQIKNLKETFAIDVEIFDNE